MDADKLNEAAVDRWVKYIPTVCLFNNIFTDAFKLGANWLMQQLLADRLTDEEKERIKQTYTSLCRKVANPELPSDYIDCATAQMLILESIFGTELFNEK